LKTQCIKKISCQNHLQEVENPFSSVKKNEKSKTTRAVSTNASKIASLKSDNGIRRDPFSSAKKK
jgi:hypothetical protein